MFRPFLGADLRIVLIGHLCLTGTSMARMWGDVVGKERTRIHNDQSFTVETNLGANFYI